MERACFVLQIKKNCIEEYRKNHNPVWPEMLQAMHKAGYRNCSMFLRDDGLLVVYFEADNLEQTLEKLGEDEVNKQWQANMSKYFDTETGDLNKETGGRVEEFFYAS